jgi:hypothetical protein
LFFANFVSPASRYLASGRELACNSEIEDFGVCGRSDRRQQRTYVYRGEFLSTRIEQGEECKIKAVVTGDLEGLEFARGGLTPPTVPMELGWLHLSEITVSLGHHFEFKTRRETRAQLDANASSRGFGDGQLQPKPSGIGLMSGCRLGRYINRDIRQASAVLSRGTWALSRLAL